VNSNVSRPMPRANTGSRLLNWVSDTTMFLLQMERRIDHWLRPAFDATLRDPIARLITALMNRQRRNDGLKIAEEKQLPNEEEYLDSVVESFTTQMRGLWKPGGFERGGNTKTQGIVRGEFIVHDDLPPQFRHTANVSLLGALFRAGALYHSRHRRRRLHEHQHQTYGRARAKVDG
jgi:hypothetical protein